MLRVARICVLQLNAVQKISSHFYVDNLIVIVFIISLFLYKKRFIFAVV